MERMMHAHTIRAAEPWEEPHPEPHPDSPPKPHPGTPTPDEPPEGPPSPSGRELVSLHQAQRQTGRVLALGRC